MFSNRIGLFITKRKNKNFQNEPIVLEAITKYVDDSDEERPYKKMIKT